MRIVVFNSTTLKKAIFIILALIGGLYLFYKLKFDNYWTSKRQISEKLSNHPQLFILPIDKQALHPHMIDLKVKGTLNGVATISYGWTDSANYQTDTISNDFEITHKNDWYNDTCYILFTPISSTNGVIEVNSKIFSSKKDTY